MEKLMNILMEIDSSIAWDKEEKLIDSAFKEYYIYNPSEIIPENLNSVNAMWRMITKLQES